AREHGLAVVAHRELAESAIGKRADGDERAGAYVPSTQLVAVRERDELGAVGRERERDDLLGARRSGPNHLARFRPHSCATGAVEAGERLLLRRANDAVVRREVDVADLFPRGLVVVSPLFVGRDEVLTVGDRAELRATRLHVDRRVVDARTIARELQRLA